jgi:hypothetical protein
MDLRYGAAHGPGARGEDSPKAPLSPSAEKIFPPHAASWLHGSPLDHSIMVTGARSASRGVAIGDDDSD